MQRRWIVWLDQIRQDVRHTARLMRWSPGFTAVTVLTLALGLSTNVTLVSFINLLLFRPLPVKDADRLVVLMEQARSGEAAHGLSWADYRDYRGQVPEFSDMLALLFRPAQLGVAGRAPERVWIEAVSSNYFSMLGVTPGAGRLFVAGEGETPGADPIVVLAHHYWQTHLGADRSVVGRTVALNGQAMTVVGITPPEFTSAQWSLAPAAFVPATMLPALFPGYERLLESREQGAFRVMAHLRPGVDVPRAAAAAQVVAARLARTYRVERQAGGEDPRVLVWPELRTRPVPTLSRFIPFAAALFLAMAVMVLFIACANVANLMFSRALARQQEMRVRSAIGASRGRLIRQLLTESVCLALLAGIAGLALSSVTGILLARVAPQGDIPVRPDTGGAGPIALLTIVVSIVAGVATGLVPALRGTQAGVQASRRRGGFRAQLVMSQVAVCVVVLVSGGLFLRSLQSLASHDLGFRPERLLMASIDLGVPRYGEGRGRRLIEQLTERLRAEPGVASAAVGTSVPFDTSFEIRTVMRADDGEGTAAARSARPAPGATVRAPSGAERTRGLRAGVNRVDAAYVTTMGVTLVRGRDLTPGDRVGAPRVAVVNQTLAERLWPGRDPLHRRIRWQQDDGDPIEVVGVVRDGKYAAVGEAPRAFVYLPIAQDRPQRAGGASGADDLGSVTLHVRAASGDPLALAPSLRRVVHALDPDLAIFNVRTMEEHLRSSVFAFFPLRVGAMFAGIQGLLGLFLAVMSVYAVVAYAVRRHTRDIGVRLALGARDRDVLRVVTAAALRPTLIGLALGVAAAVALARVLARLLYGLHPIDPPVFLGVTVVVLLVSLIACWLPARRALRIDPIAALRAD